MKIVVNKSYGGFGLSEELCQELCIPWEVGYGYLKNVDFGITSINPYECRANPKLVEAVERLGLKNSSGKHASLEIVEIPDGVGWEILECGGVESVHEIHRSWY